MKRGREGSVITGWPNSPFINWCREPLRLDAFPAKSFNNTQEGGYRTGDRAGKLARRSFIGVREKNESMCLKANQEL